jgi:hypothetical protein
MANGLDYWRVRLASNVSEVIDLQYSVVFEFVSTGFAGFDSYGPVRSLERAIVTMCSLPVPPTAQC